MNLLRCFSDDVTPGPLMGLPRVAFVGWEFWAKFWKDLGDQDQFPTTERLHAIADESVGHLTMLDIECWPPSRLLDYVRISDILHARQPSLRLGWFNGLPGCGKYAWWRGGRSAAEEPYGWHGTHGYAERYWEIVNLNRKTGEILQRHADVVFPACYLRGGKHIEDGTFQRFMLERVRRCWEDYGCAVYPVLFPRRIQANPKHEDNPDKEPKNLYPTILDSEWKMILGIAAALEKEGTAAGTVIWDAKGYARKGWETWTAKTPWVLAAAAAAEGVLP